MILSGVGFHSSLATALPPALSRVEQEYAKAGTLHANFTQKVWNESLQEEKISTGILILKMPNKFRWEIRDPDPLLLLSNGKKFWFYTPPMDSTDKGEAWSNSSEGDRWVWLSQLLSAHWSGVPGLKVQAKAQAFELTIPAATKWHMGGALRFGWSFPAYKGRPGRRPEDML